MNIPNFQPDIPPHLLADLDAKDRYLHEQLSITSQFVRHVALEQCKGTDDRKKTLECMEEMKVTVKANHEAFKAHAQEDSTVFHKQAEWQVAHGRIVSEGFAALKWLRPDTYFNGKALSKIILAVLTAAVVAVVLRNWNLK